MRGLEVYAGSSKQKQTSEILGHWLIEETKDSPATPGMTTPEGVLLLLVLSPATCGDFGGEKQNQKRSQDAGFKLKSIYPLRKPLFSALIFLHNAIEHSFFHNYEEQR